MGRWKKNSKEFKVRVRLINRFHEKERLSINDILSDYFDPKTVYAALVAKGTAKSLLNSIKYYFKKKGIPFGCINDDEEWGIPTTEEEYKYALQRRYKNVKGTIMNSEHLWIRSAKRMGYLKELKREEALVARINGEEDES